VAEMNTVESRIPARLDRLPFSRWHWLVIAALGITWMLDGLEVTIVGNIAAVLTDPSSGLGLTEGQVGFAGGIYNAGACLGPCSFPTSLIGMAGRSSSCSRSPSTCSSRLPPPFHGISGASSSSGS
jgi:hypothetical protein